MSRRTASNLFWLAAVLLLHSNHAAADDTMNSPAVGGPRSTTSFLVDAGAMYSDNITLAQVDKHSDLEPLADIGWSIERLGPRLDLTSAGLVSYVGYPREYAPVGQSADDLNGSANLALRGMLLPERFWWNVQDSFGQTLVDLAAPNTAVNRQITNVVSTGPKIVVPLGARNELVVDGSWIKSNFADSEQTNGTGYQGDVSLVRNTSRTGSLALEVSASRIVYDQQQENSDFDVRSAYMSWRRKSLRDELTLDVGYSELQQAGIRYNSPLVRLMLLRRLSARTTLTFSAGREFSDAASNFQANRSFFGATGSLADIGSNADPFRSDYGRLAWSVQGNRLTASIQATARLDTYESSNTENARFYGVAGSIDRALSARVSLLLQAKYEERKFTTLNQFAIEKNYSAGLSILMTQTISILPLLTRITEIGNGIQTSYSEDQVWVRIRYTPVIRR